MGIAIGSSLIVGLYAKEILSGSPTVAGKVDDMDYLGEAMESLGLEYASPCFDDGMDECLWGVPIAYSYSGFAVIADPASIGDTIKAAMDKFKGITGLDAKLYVTSHVT